MTDLERALLAVVAELQDGQVVSYGWVAAEACLLRATAD